jgi:hypothetical protein
VQLHLEVELLRLARGDVDSDLAHRLDDVWPDRVGRCLAGRLGANIRRRVTLEERLRHLRAAGVVRADEQDVFHGFLL